MTTLTDTLAFVAFGVALFALFTAWGILRRQRRLTNHLAHHCEELARLHELNELHELCQGEFAARA